MVKTPGLREIIGSRLLETGLCRLYEEIGGGKGSFTQDISHRILDSTVRDPYKSDRVTLREFAQRHGCQPQLYEYLNDELRLRKSYLVRALDLVTSAKDCIDDSVEAAEAAGTVAGAATGAGSVVVQIGGNLVEIPLHAAVQIIYTGVAGLLGFAGRVYSPNLKGVFDYSIDTAKGAAGAITDMIPVFGSLTELLTNLDDKRPRIASSLAENVRNRLLRNMKLDSITESDTVKVVPYLHGKAQPYLADTGSRSYKTLAAA